MAEVNIVKDIAERLDGWQTEGTGFYLKSIYFDSDKSIRAICTPYAKDAKKAEGDKGKYFALLLERLTEQYRGSLAFELEHISKSPEGYTLVLKYTEVSE